MASVLEISKYLDSRVPFSTKLDFDNVGLLAGEPNAQVSRVLCALDITDEVIAEAAEMGAELIVSHHPLIFHALKSVCGDNYIGRRILALARSGISAICMHTNLDAAVGGVNDALMQALGIESAQPLCGEGDMARIGTLPEPMTMQAFLERSKNAIRANGLRYFDSGKLISVVGCCGGSGGDYIDAARAAGCDVFVTADVKYDQFVAARAYNFSLIDGGHFNTENVVLPALRQLVLDGFPDLDVRLSKTLEQPEQFYM